MKPLISILLIFSLLGTSLTDAFNATAPHSGLLIRKRRQFNALPDPFHARAGVNEEGQALAPLVLTISHNLTSNNGPKGRCGVCARTYRVIKDLQFKPSVECRRYSDSRQAALGDLTEFYHAVSYQRLSSCLNELLSCL